MRVNFASIDPALLPTTREAAKAAGISRFFTGVACVNGRLAPRFTSSGACVICAKRNQKKWNACNTDKLREYDKQSYQRHQEKRVLRSREYRRKHPEKAAATTKKYRQANAALINSLGSEYRARKHCAMPLWVDRSAIKEIYAQCKQMNKAEGAVYHVDHIVPLKNDLVCGLHVPWNLRIITATENYRKKNKLVSEVHDY